MKQVLVGEAFREGWRQFMVRPWYLFGLSLGVMVLFVASSGSRSGFTALAYILYMGYVAALFMHYGGKKISFDDMFAPLHDRWISLAFTAMLKGLLILLGLLVFIVPGIYLAIRWMFAELLVIDQGMKPMEALRASSAMTKGHRWKLLWFSFLSSLLLLVGVVGLVVGVVVASVVITFAVIKLYYDLK